MSRYSRKKFVIDSGSFDEFVLQRVRIRDVDRPPTHFNQAGSVQAPQVSRDEFPNRAESSGKFFVVLRKLELNSSRGLASGLFCQSQEVRDQTAADRGERQAFNKTHQVAQPVAENFEDFEGELRVLQTDSSKSIGGQSKDHGRTGRLSSRGISAPIKHWHFREGISSAFNGGQLLSSVRS